MLFNPLDISCCNPSPVPESFPRGFSYLEEIGYLIGEINKLIYIINENDNITTKNCEEFKKLKDKVDLLQLTINQFKDGKSLPNSSIHLRHLASDVFKELDTIVCNRIIKSAKFISFGIDEEKIYCEIPTSWNNVKASQDLDGKFILEIEEE